jgi:hypothetical protein
MTYQEALNILKNHQQYTAAELQAAIDIVKLKMFQR